jgi:hypothetical protein
MVWIRVPRLAACGGAVAFTPPLALCFPAAYSSIFFPGR